MSFPTRPARCPTWTGDPGRRIRCRWSAGAGGRALRDDARLAGAQIAVDVKNRVVILDGLVI
jgi:hypothetical protein